MDCFEAIRRFPGEVGVYYRVLGTNTVWTRDPDRPLIAASLIKLPIMVTAFRDIGLGLADPDERFRIEAKDKMPSCGALAYMHDGLEVTLTDLVTLMIILSDNTAANLLIDRLTMPRVNGAMEELAIPGVALRRRLFDAEQAARGVENTVTARGMGVLLERIAAGTLLGGRADEAMLAILRSQRLNGKLPFHLHGRGIPCAHKTGEDDGITHDAGIIYARRPFVLCMLSNHVDVPAFDRLIQDTALACAFGGSHAAPRP